MELGMPYLIKWDTMIASQFLREHCERKKGETAISKDEIRNPSEDSKLLDTELLY
jgi:hypothetical protein